MTTVGPPEGVRTVPRPLEHATRIVLIRHGQAETNVGGVIQAATCSGLNALGHAQAVALAERLERSGELREASVLYASGLLRAQQTAAAIAPALGLEVAGHLPALNELEPGEAEGMAWDDYAERFGDLDLAAQPDVPFAPGGESWNAFRVRVAVEVDRLIAAHRGGTVVAVTHAGVIEAAMVHLSGLSTSRKRLRPEHTSITSWVEVGPHLALERFGDAAHLGA